MCSSNRKGADGEALLPGDFRCGNRCCAHSRDGDLSWQVGAAKTVRVAEEKWWERKGAPRKR